MTEKANTSEARQKKREREYADNRRYWLSEEEKLYARWEEAYYPGGQDQVDRLIKQGKKPVRELIRQLIDPGTEFFELSRGAGFGINYESTKDVPSAGLATGLGKVHGNWVMMICNDSRVKAGAYYPINTKKHLRAQDIADEAGIPCVYIADSAGGFLPMQAGVFPGRGQFGRFFFNMCRMSAKGLKQYTLSTGGNTAGGAYIVYLACESIMIDKMAYSFLGGPPMVKSAIGEVVSMEELGGAKVHTGISGGADHFVRSQDEGIEKLRELLSYDPKQKLCIERRETKEPRVPITRLYEILPKDTYRGINVREVIATIADDSCLSEYKRNYNPGRGDNIVCGKIYIKGIPVGVIASNNNGVIYVDAARKATEWVVRCCTQKIPLLYIQASPGYMVGTQEEYAGIGKYGSDMVRACACAKVPKVQWVIGPDHGAANYGMCGRAYDPRFIFHTMRARTSVMSGQTAGFILTSLERANAKKAGREMDEEAARKFQEMMVDKYSREAHPFFLEARLFQDGTLPFKDCRDALATAFEVSLLKPIEESSFGNFKF
ncbi:MAG TPA: carboxyl transferase domain-containing protein [Syntrophales bacterium]|nr:carboxyl transferase domain-containing protein [Syntrophales bacterium]HOD99402.1 carboxyl transferase domain-containing protein [Syntrophales bacterium]HPN10285.1 carboxyl transferase domain-containing protein [Syntrophales bacterium]HPX81880.1 carboxyl transferase domain-containing protein [Syntrophales bacterium]HQB15021.1 carboxyl transferase domain-containing protein [Syntrophales bacterium]